MTGTNAGEKFPNTHRESGEADFEGIPQNTTRVAIGELDVPGPVDTKAAEIGDKGTLRHQYMCAVLQGLCANPNFIYQDLGISLRNVGGFDSHKSAIARGEAERIAFAATEIVDSALKNEP